MWKKSHIFVLIFLFKSTQGHPEGNSSNEVKVQVFYRMSSDEIMTQWLKPITKKQDSAEFENAEDNCIEPVSTRDGNGIVTLLGVLGYAAQFSFGILGGGSHESAAGYAMLMNAGHYYREE